MSFGEQTHVRAHGLQALLKIEVARPTIDPYHVKFAQARRPQVSWQNLAKMLGVCALDLQRACEHPEQVQAAFAVTPPKAAQAPEPEARVVHRHRGVYRRPHVDGGTLEHDALIAIAAGQGFPIQLAGVLRRDRNQANSLITTLRYKGFVQKPGRFDPAILSEAGVAELKRLDAMVDAGEADW
jgi:hypothetical protein